MARRGGRGRRRKQKGGIVPPIIPALALGALGTAGVLGSGVGAGVGTYKGLNNLSVRRKQKGMGRRYRRRRKQRGGVFPLLAAAIPALIAAGKAAALGSVSGAAAFGIKKGLDKV